MKLFTETPRIPPPLEEYLKYSETRVVSLGCEEACCHKVSYPLYAMSGEEPHEDLFSALGIQRPMICLQENDIERLLAPKEYEVVLQLIHGNSYKAIAENLEISGSTVQSYKERAMGKLGVSNLSDLAVLCAASGIRSCPCKTMDYQI